MTYVCDPVMGDVAPVGWYVPESLLPIYKEEIIPLADICIPNEFELALLTDTKVEYYLLSNGLILYFCACAFQVIDERSAVDALRKLNAMGVETAVVSSCSFGNSKRLDWKRRQATN